MRWFGYRPFAIVCEGSPRTETPTGEPCLWCDDAIGPDEDGFMVPFVGFNGMTTEKPLHAECHLRTIIGGANHQAGTCTCYGGYLPADPPDLTAREAAVLALDFYFSRRRR